MEKCGDCKHLKQEICHWWLCQQEEAEQLRQIRDCFIPNYESEYPMIPQQREGTRICIYPSHHGRCFYCGNELTGRKRSYCSKEHRLNYYSRFDWGSVRNRVWHRDTKQCVQCDTEVDFFDAEIDHIQAVSLGGGYWDYVNLQTLCKTCHNKKTRKDLGHLKANKLKTTILAKVKPLEEWF